MVQSNNSSSQVGEGGGRQGIAHLSSAHLEVLMSTIAHLCIQKQIQSLAHLLI